MVYNTHFCSHAHHERATKNSRMAISETLNNYSTGNQGNSRYTAHNHLQDTEKKSVTVLLSTAVCLLCYNYLSHTKLLECSCQVTKKHVR